MDSVYRDDVDADGQENIFPCYLQYLCPRVVLPTFRTKYVLRVKMIPSLFWRGRNIVVFTTLHRVLQPLTCLGWRKHWKD